MYRGEIQNDSNGGNYNRSLDYTPSSGGLGYAGRGETRNFAVGAPLRGGGENEEMEDDPCWEGYEMIGTKMKKGREVPNCVPVEGGDKPAGAIEVPNMENFIRLFSLGNKQVAEKLDNAIYGNGKPFTKKQLLKIILDKNKVIADLEENAYGGADVPYSVEGHKQVLRNMGYSEQDIAELVPQMGAGFWEDVRKGLVKHNERKKTTPISIDDWKKQMEDFKAPTENWGADELNGDGFFGDIFKQADKEGKEKWDKLSPEEKLRAEIRQNVRVHQGQAGFFNKRHYEKLAKLDADYESNLARRIADAKEMGRPVNESAISALRASRRKATEDFAKEMAALGGAAPKAEPKAPSGVAAAAEALQPVRTAIQNKVGDLIYGAETDPRKQKKGLLGISEEGKEESKKKVLKNIVVPVVTLFNDTWDSVFDPEKLKKRRYDESLAKARAAGIKAAERDGYVYKTPDGQYTYDNMTGDVRNEVIRKPRVAQIWVQKNAKYNTGYFRYDMEGKAQGFSPYVEIPNPIKGENRSVEELKKNNIPFFIPVDRLTTSGDNEARWGDFLNGDKVWVPEDKAREIYQSLNQYKVKLEEEKERAYYESLSEVEKKEYREAKALERDNAVTETAKAKVAKDIADEEAKENPDTAKLAKMKAAQERVRVKGVENYWKGATQAKKVSERIYSDKMTKDVAEREAANAQEQADAAETWKAMTPAERSVQIDAYRKDLQEQGFSEESIDDMVSQIGEQGVVAVGGAGSDDEDEEDVDIIEVVLSKMERYFVDASPKNEKGEFVGLPLGTYKKAISGPLGIGNRRVYDPETEEELGFLKDPIFKKLAMKVLKMEKGWRDENLKKLGFKRDEDSDADSIASASSRGGGAKPVEMKQGDYYKEHQNIVKLLKDTGKSLLSEAKDQQGEATAMAKKMGAPDPFDDDELVGEGAIEFTLAKAGMVLFNPTGNMTMAGKQTFTPSYDAYGDTAAQGRENAFALARSMYNQAQPIEIPGFDLYENNTSLRFYIKDDENVVLVGIRGTDVKSYTDLYTWAVIGFSGAEAFNRTTRFQEDLLKLQEFQKEFPQDEFYYVATGSSLAGSIADRFLDMGLISEAITYNPSIERKYILDGKIENHRVYLDTDPLFILMGQYAPNVEIRKNASRADFYNPIKEKDYLIKSHSIYPVFNPAFEGGGMMGAGKTYTIEEWKAIFDAKLEQKRQQIEAREAKKKQTAKAKRERAKARRDARDEPPPLETPAIFRTSRTMKATPPKEPEPAPKPKEPRKPRLKVVARAKDEPPPLEAPFRTSRVMKATPPIVKRTAEQRERDEEIERLKDVIKKAQAEAREIDEFLKGFEGLTPAGQRAIKSSEEDRREAWSRERKAQSQLNTLRQRESDEYDKKVNDEKVAKFMRENDGRKPLVREEISSQADEERLGVTKYKFGTKFYYVEDPRGDRDMNLGFYKSRQVLEAYDYRGKTLIVLIGRLGEEKQPFQGLMKQIIKAEFPSEKVYRETMGLEAPPKKPKAPASARVELRQELVAEQPRKPEGEFASEAEPLQLVVSEIAKQPQGAFMKLMKSPKLTEADRRLFMRLKETKMTPKMRAILLGRSGLARRVMEIMGLDESAFQTKKARLKIADTTEMRVKSETAREVDAQGWIDIKKEWKRAATLEINRGLKRTGDGERAVKSAKDILKDISEWCIDSVECLRDAMITDWQGAWTINQEGRMVDADGDKFYSRGKVGTDVWKNKTPLLTIKDTVKTASDTNQESDEVRTYNLVIGEKRQAILLDGGGGDADYDKWTIPMRALYGFFPLMGLPIPTCKKQGRFGMMKLEIDWKEMPLVRSYKSLTAKAKEEIQEKLRSEYAPKLTAFIDMARSKLEDCVEEAIKGRVKYVNDGKWRPSSKMYDDRSWQPE